MATTEQHRGGDRQRSATLPSRHRTGAESRAAEPLVVATGKNVARSGAPFKAWRRRHGAVPDSCGTGRSTARLPRGLHHLQAGADVVPRVRPDVAMLELPAGATTL